MPIKSRIRTVPHWPKTGIMFRDITTLLKDPVGLKICIEDFIKRYIDKDIDVVVGIDSRGFILGGAIAYVLGKGFVPVRKKASCRQKPKVRNTPLNTGRMLLRSIRMP